MTAPADEETRKALGEQKLYAQDLVNAGYTREHAAQMAIKFYPTPAQARMAHARNKKKEKVNGNG